MNRHIRAALVVGLVVVLPVLASCQALATTPGATPSPNTAHRSAGPPYAGSPQINLAKCAVGSQGESVESRSLKMISPTTGWALGQCTLGARPSFANGSTIQCIWPQAELVGILRTTDGGATWTDVSPPSVANRTWHHAQFFLDANHAWVGEVSRTADACVTQLTTFVTSNGGQTWQQGGTIALKTATPTDDVFNVGGAADGMDFVDAQHGWLMVTSPPSNPQPGAMIDATTLYSTTDGGLHWKLVATNPGQLALTTSPGCQSSGYAPASDAVFDSATSGWLAIACATGVAPLRTDDGGATWTVKPLSCRCQVWQAEYLDASDAVFTGTQGSTSLVTTGDGGISWAQRTVPRAALALFSFLNRRDGWMVGIEQLAKGYDTVVYRTTDGGQSWSLLGKPGFASATSSPEAYYPIQAMQFVDAHTGFVVLGQEAAPGGATDPTAPQLQILTTADGGRNWSTVLKQVPAMPCSGHYGPPGYGPGSGLKPVKMASSAIGWAKGGLRTTDGGAHWRDVSPPALREGASTPLYPPGYGDFYLDGDHAWQAGVYGSKSSCTDHVSTFATADGGKTWQQSAPVTVSLSAGDQVGAPQIGFTSPQVGWLWVPTGPSANDPMAPLTSAASLYSTSDSGGTWRQVSSFGNSDLKGIPAGAGSQGCTPSPARVTFSTPSVGWLSLNCTDNTHLVTHDGGATWKVEKFPTSGLVCPCFGDIPNFVDASHGFVSVTGSDPSSPASTLLLRTTDGGITWGRYARPGTGYVISLDSVNSNDLFALVTPPGWNKGSSAGFDLYRSLDGGGTWTLVNPAVPASWPPGFFQFVDLKNGFESNVNGATELLATADGGISWTSITPATEGQK
jgi:photosystem II stability/assembly factor-like uncharacterized protein